MVGSSAGGFLKIWCSIHDCYFRMIGALMPTKAFKDAIGLSQKWDLKNVVTQKRWQMFCEKGVREKDEA